MKWLVNRVSGRTDVVEADLIKFESGCALFFTSDFENQPSTLVAAFNQDTWTVIIPGEA